MADIKWIKLTTDIFDDEKIRVIEKMPEGDTMLIIWLKLLTLAGKKNDSGMVYLTDNIPYTPEILSDIFNREARLISLALNTFASFGMIEIESDIITVLNWEKHQNIEGMDKIREQNRIRQNKYRQNKQLLDSNVTSRDSNGTDKIRIDKNKMKEEFDCFWEAYPKKEGKKACETKFSTLYKKKILPNLEEHIHRIELWSKTERWQKGFIPNPSTWLNQERWNDDIPEPWTDPEVKASNAAAATTDVFWKICPDCGYITREISGREQCPSCGEYGVSFKQGRGAEYPKEIA